MKIKSRSFRTNHIVPKPLIYLSPDEKLVVVVTPWCELDIAQKTLDDFSSYFQTVNADLEVTSLYDFNESLSQGSNRLLTALQISNERMKKSENRERLTAGLEIAAFVLEGRELSWVQLGMPQIFLKKKGFSLQCLGGATNLNLEYNQTGLALLPSQLLGVEKKCYPQCGSFKVGTSDKIYLISAPFISDEVYTGINDNTGIDEITRLIAKKYKNMSFWLGCLEI